MKSKTGGKSILEVEVTNISIHGFWILIGEKEYFLSFTEFPWFRDATIAEITDVTIVKKEHLFWEKLDVDLTLNMIENPENYPLISK
jgi:hypothetical protein